jgi:hypothetical protein
MLEPDLSGPKSMMESRLLGGVHQVRHGRCLNPTGPLTDFEMMARQAAAAALGLRLQIVNAALPVDFEEAFKEIARSGAGALLLSGGALFLNYR